MKNSRLPESHDVFNGSGSDDRMTVWVRQFHFYLVLIKVGEVDEGVGGGGAVFLSLCLHRQ